MIGLFMMDRQANFCTDMNPEGVVCEKVKFDALPSLATFCVRFDLPVSLIMFPTN